MPNDVHVRRYARRPHPGRKIPGMAKPAAAAVTGPHWRLPSTPGSLGAVIDDVVAERRSGYTWTRNFKFDIADASSMERVYDGLGDRAMYVVGTTNRSLGEWEFGLEARDPTVIPKIGANEGVGVWRDPDTDEVFVDDIVLFFGPKVSESWALNFAKNQRQKFILKIHGLSRSFEFLEVD